RSYGDWSSDVCSSDLLPMYPSKMGPLVAIVVRARQFGDRVERLDGVGASGGRGAARLRRVAVLAFLAFAIYGAAMNIAQGGVPRSEERRVGQGGRWGW